MPICNTHYIKKRGLKNDYFTYNKFELIKIKITTDDINQIIVNILNQMLIANFLKYFPIK